MKTPVGVIPFLIALVPLWAGAQTCLSPSEDFGDGRDRFGNALSINGDHAAVLAAGDQAVYVYRHQDGAWERTFRLSLPPVATPQSSDALYIDDAGSELLVGVPVADVSTVARAGAVYVYRRTQAGWVLSQSLSATVPEEGAYFGGRLVVEGDDLLVGAHRETVDAEPGAGAAYSFVRRPDGSYQATGRLVAPAPQAFAGFGFGLAMSQGRAVVGAQGEIVGEEDLAGAAHVYLLSTPPQWRQTLTAPAPEFAALFGATLMAEGAELVVADAALQGARAFRFTFDGATYVPGADLGLGLAAGERIYDGVLAGGTAVMGIVPVAGPGLGVGERVLLRDLASGTTRTIAGGHTGPGLDALPSFGASVASDGAHLLVGEAGVDVGSNRDQGQASLFRFADGTRLRTLRHGAGRAAAQLGTAVVGDGDAVWVSEPGYDAARDDLGRVIELVPDGDGWRSARQVVGEGPGEQFGAVIARRGELLAVTSSDASVPNVASRGRVQVFRTLPGAAIGAPVCTLAAPGGGPAADFGTALALGAGRLVVREGLPNANPRFHVYEIGADACTPVATISAATLGLPAQDFGASVVFVGNHLAIGQPRLAPDQVGRVHILQPTGGGYALLTSLDQPGDPTLVSAMGSELVANDALLAVLAAPLSVNGVPLAGAVLFYARSGDTYAFVGRVADPSTPGSPAWGSFTGLALTADRIVVGSRAATGERSFLHMTLDALTAWAAGAALSPSPRTLPLFATSNRVGVGNPSDDSNGAPARGVLQARQWTNTAGAFDPVQAFNGSLPELLHCSGFDSGG